MPTAPTESSEVSSATSSMQLASELLGGRRVLHRQVASEEDAHELVLRGIPAEAMARPPINSRRVSLLLGDLVFVMML